MRRPSSCAPSPRDGGEELLAQRVVDHRVLEPAAHLAGDRDREHREAVQEVRGAVERIDDPEVLVAAAAAAFLREESRGPGYIRRMVSMMSLLGRVVDLGDEVVAALA